MYLFEVVDGGFIDKLRENGCAVVAIPPHFLNGVAPELIEQAMMGAAEQSICSSSNLSS
jgi:hypothetical protein